MALRGYALRTINDMNNPAVPKSGDMAAFYGWPDALRARFFRDDLKETLSFVAAEREKYRIYPAAADIFNAFRLTPFVDIRVVILGQDPYHGAGQAHGLSFSVPAGVRLPPSLRNIYKEIERSMGVKMPPHGDLTPWARQGVFLLNTTLSVREGAAGSHSGKGWESFTDAAISCLSDQRDNIVFMLWGSHAQKKEPLIDGKRHLVLKAPHPSPLSAHRGFIGCDHFIKANSYLRKHGGKSIDWATL